MNALLAQPYAPSEFHPTTVTSGSADITDLYPQSISQQPETPAWANHFVKRINDFLAVQGTKGTVNGVFLSMETIFKAVSLLSFISSENTEPPLIALNDNGSLHFEWESEKDFLTVTLNSNIEFYFESEGTEEPIESNTNDVGVLRKILQTFQT